MWPIMKRKVIDEDQIYDNTNDKDMKSRYYNYAQE